MEEYVRLDACALAELVRRDEVRPLELLDLALARAQALQPALGCIAVWEEQEARRILESGPPSGPFSGVPFLLKDLHAFRTGTVLTNGSRLVRDDVATFDSTLIARFLAAGLVPFGKTASPEFGLNVVTEPVLHGPCRNPWNPAFSPGGSSGGAAAAVAAGIVPVAHASDGGGSIRIPASHCGLVGLKPSRARTPVGPHVVEAWSGLATAHVLARTVRDAAAMLDAVHGPEAGDVYACPRPAGSFAEAARRDPPRRRIGLIRGAPTGVAVHPDVATVLEQAAALLADAGHAVEETELPLEGAAFGDAFLAVVAAHVARDVDWWSQKTGRPVDAAHLEQATLALVERGRALGAVDFVTALRGVQAVGRLLGRLFSRFDLLLSPVCAAPAPRVGEVDQNGDPEAFLAAHAPYVAFTAVHNAAGTPAISIPFGSDARGLPVGVMFAAPLGREEDLLEMAGWIERVRPWPDPALSVPFAPKA